MEKQETLPLSDLHCHILPGIDDGAADAEVSRTLLDAERQAGVRQIMFTPHFYADEIDETDFLIQRSVALRKINAYAEQFGIETKLGAEVKMVPELLKMDLRPFCYGQSDYLLLEWPTSMYPLWGDEIVERLLDAGIRPIFAHIERYEYFFLKPENLESYIERGILCQINTGTLLHSATQKTALSLLERGYAHVLSTDTHNMDRRPPRMTEAMDVARRKLSRGTVQQLLQNADDIFHGRPVDASPPKKKHKGFAFWR